MRFANTRRPEEQCRFGIAHKLETCQPNAHLDTALVLSDDLALAEQE